MSITSGIMKNHSLLKFRVILPERTSKRSHYPYQKLLTDYAADYLKKYHSSAKLPGLTIIKFNEIYDGCIYLELVIPIFNHKFEETIIEVT